MNSTSRSPRSVFVVLPAYNEAASIGVVLSALARSAFPSTNQFHAIVVDDGSSDGTARIARELAGDLPLTLVEHSRNLGLGATIRDGLVTAVDLSRDGDIIVTMDADDTHTPAAIAGMLEKIDQGCDVLIASRYQPGSRVIGVPATRRVLSYFVSLLFRLVLPIHGVRDFTCGYRAYRASILRGALAQYREEFVNQEGFQCMVDILLKLRHMGLKFGEVPIVLRYDRKEGKSKMRVIPTIFRTLALLVRRRLGL